MSVRKVKPTSRGTAVPDHLLLRGDHPEHAGEVPDLWPDQEVRPQQLRPAVTSRRRGGGHKRSYRLIDFKREKLNIPAKVATVEYDPNRSARIALLHYTDGEKRYILAPVGMNVGDVVLSGDSADIKPGNAMRLGRIPVGTVVHNVELAPGKGGQFCRAAGTYCPAHRQGRQVRPAAAALRRSAQHPVRLHRHGGPGGQHPPRADFPGQGWPQTAGWAAVPMVRGVAMNPHRPPPWRWRGQELRRPPSLHPVG